MTNHLVVGRSDQNFFSCNYCNASGPTSYFRAHEGGGFVGRICADCREELVNKLLGQMRRDTSQR